MKRQVLLLVLLLAVSATSYRCGKQIADLWYAAHPVERTEILHAPSSTADFMWVSCYSQPQTSVASYSWSDGYHGSSSTSTTERRVESLEERMDAVEHKLKGSKP